MKKLILMLSLVFVMSLQALGGSLEPSAAPAPTMKTLDEVEPRVPIRASDLPLTITEPNSYYLVEDVNFTDNANHAITIECNDVTIDLMGYTLKGPDLGSSYGIYMSARNNVEIRNGTVRDFVYGIYEDSSQAFSCRVIDVRATSNVLAGIYLLGCNHLVKNCTASDNGDNAIPTVYGIRAGSGSTVTGNTVNENGDNATNNVYGIYASVGSTVTGNTVSKNGASAAKPVVGICATSGCTVTGNTVNNNGDTATDNVYGIYVGYGSTVTGNTVYDNGDHAVTVYGIYLYQGYNLVDQNTSSSNGTSATGSATNLTLGVVGCVYGVNVGS
jgi:parallel beta-helix repeat protein